MTNELPEWIAPEDQHPLHLHEPISSSQLAKYPSETTPIPSYFPGGLWRFPPLRFPPIDLTNIDDVRQLPDLPRGPNFQPKVVRLQNDYYAHTPDGWCKIMTDCNVTAAAALAFGVWSDESAAGIITNGFVVDQQDAAVGLLSLAIAHSVGSINVLANGVGTGVANIILTCTPVTEGDVLVLAIANHTGASPPTLQNAIQVTDSQGGSWDNDHGYIGPFVNWASVVPSNGYGFAPDAIFVHVASHVITAADVASGLVITVTSTGLNLALAAAAVEVSNLAAFTVDAGFHNNTPSLTVDVNELGDGTDYFHTWSDVTSPNFAAIGVVLS